MMHRIGSALRLGLFLVIAGLTACNQNPVFFSITQEVELVDPKINGTPTNIVKVDNTVYTASRFGGTIYAYKEKDSGVWVWDEFSSQGNIIELAATGTKLYALLGDPLSGTGVYEYDLVTQKRSEKPVMEYAKTQSLYGAGDYLFAGVMTSDKDAKTAIFAIYGYKEGDDDPELLKSDIPFLTGAAYDGSSTYYLATGGAGIYTYKPGEPISSEPVPDSKGLNIVGITTVGTQIVGVTRNGVIVYGTSTKFNLSGNNGVDFTGALGTWTDGAKHLLLLGIRSSSTVHGYREIVLNSDGILDSEHRGLYKPGEHEKSTLTNKSKYDSSLGRNPLGAILQAPDKKIFAATLKNGLWSYKERGGDGWIWNAEE